MEALRRPVITRTEAQAIVRARGLWKARAWCEGPDRARLSKMARAVGGAWLDGLTLLVRSFDMLHRDEVRGAIRSLLHRPVGGTGPFRVGDFDRAPIRGFGPLRTIRGDGWSWDDAFAEAEAKIEAEHAAP